MPRRGSASTYLGHPKVVDHFRILKGFDGPDGGYGYEDEISGEYAKSEALNRYEELLKWEWVPNGWTRAMVVLYKQAMVVKPEGLEPWGRPQEIMTTFRPDDEHRTSAGPEAA